MATKVENITIDQFIEHIKTMTALQLKELVSAIETEFGVTAVAATAAAAPVQEVAEVAKNVSIYLKAAGDSKVSVIKAIKEITGSDLVTSKKLVDASAEKPQIIKENVDAATLADIEAKIKAAGGEVEVK